MRKRTGRQYKDPTVPTKKRSEPIRKDVQPRVPFFTRLEELIGIFTFQWISPLMTRVRAHQHFVLRNAVDD